MQSLSSVFCQFEEVPGRPAECQSRGLRCGELGLFDLFNPHVLPHERFSQRVASVRVHLPLVSGTRPKVLFGVALLFFQIKYLDKVA